MISELSALTLFSIKREFHKLLYRIVCICKRRMFMLVKHKKILAFLLIYINCFHSQKQFTSPTKSSKSQKVMFVHKIIEKYSRLDIPFVCFYFFFSAFCVQKHMILRVKHLKLCFKVKCEQWFIKHRKSTELEAKSAKWNQCEWVELKITFGFIFSGSSWETCVHSFTLYSRNLITNKFSFGFVWSTPTDPSRQWNYKTSSYLLLYIIKISMCNNPSHSFVVS